MKVYEVFVLVCNCTCCHGARSPSGESNSDCVCFMYIRTYVHIVVLMCMITHGHVYACCGAQIPHSTCVRACVKSVAVNGGSLRLKCLVRFLAGTPLEGGFHLTVMSDPFFERGPDTGM